MDDDISNEVQLTENKVYLCTTKWVLGYINYVFYSAQFKNSIQTNKYFFCDFVLHILKMSLKVDVSILLLFDFVKKKRALELTPWSSPLMLIVNGLTFSVGLYFTVTAVLICLVYHYATCIICVLHFFFFEHTQCF